MSRTDEQFFLENLTKINKNIGIIFLIFCLVPIIFILFTLTGLWEVSHVHSLILLISTIKQRHIIEWDRYYLSSINLM